MQQNVALRSSLRQDIPPHPSPTVDTQHSHSTWDGFAWFAGPGCTNIGVPPGLLTPLYYAQIVLFLLQKGRALENEFINIDGCVIIISLHPSLCLYAFK